MSAFIELHDTHHENKPVTVHVDGIICVNRCENDCCTNVTVSEWDRAEDGSPTQGVLSVTETYVQVQMLLAAAGELGGVHRIGDRPNVVESLHSAPASPGDPGEMHQQMFDPRWN